MTTIAFTIPILPGKVEAFRSAQRRFAIDRAAEFAASRRRLGITREQGFVQRTPAEDVAVVVFETADPGRMLAGTATSPEPIDVDFRRYLLETFGLDVTRATAPPSEQVFDWLCPDHGTNE
jgi:hypothetical protein